MYASTNISLISRTQAQLAYFFNCLYALSLPGVYVISNKSIPVYNPETDTNNIYINGRYNRGILWVTRARLRPTWGTFA